MSLTLLATRQSHKIEVVYSQGIFVRVCFIIIGVMISQPNMFPPQFFNQIPGSLPPSNYRIITAPIVQPVVVQQEIIDTSSCWYHFRQQTLRPWYPLPTLCTSFILLISFGAFLLALGIVMLKASNELQEYQVRYDNQCPTINTTCTATIVVPQNIRGPVFVYYGIHNFYQNHRLFSRSKKSRQLFGSLYSVTQQNGECSPISKNSDLNNGATTSITGAPLDPNGPVNPCGLTAMTVFNDTYVITGPGGIVPVSANDISWKGDQQKIRISDPAVMWFNTTDQRFQNWIRVASQSNFRKLWGRIDSDLPAGSYLFTITNNYDVSSIFGQKYLALANANNFGGKNKLLSIMYLSIGSLFLFLSVVVGILWCLRRTVARRKLI